MSSTHHLARACEDMRSDPARVRAAVALAVEAGVHMEDDAHAENARVLSAMLRAQRSGVSFIEAYVGCTMVFARACTLSDAGKYSASEAWARQGVAFFRGRLGAATHAFREHVAVGHAIASRQGVASSCALLHALTIDAGDMDDALDRLCTALLRSGTSPSNIQEVVLHALHRLVRTGGARATARVEGYLEACGMHCLARQERTGRDAVDVVTRAVSAAGGVGWRDALFALEILLRRHTGNDVDAALGAPNASGDSPCAVIVAAFAGNADVWTHGTPEHTAFSYALGRCTRDAFGRVQGPLADYDTLLGLLVREMAVACAPMVGTARDGADRAAAVMLRAVDGGGKRVRAARAVGRGRALFACGLHDAGAVVVGYAVSLHGATDATRLAVADDVATAVLESGRTPGVGTDRWLALLATGKSPSSARAAIDAPRAVARALEAGLPLTATRIVRATFRSAIRHVQCVAPCERASAPAHLTAYAAACDVVGWPHVYARAESPFVTVGGVRRHPWALPYSARARVLAVFGCAVRVGLPRNVAEAVVKFIAYVEGL